MGNLPVECEIESRGGVINHLENNYDLSVHPEPLAPVLPGHGVLDELVLLEVLGLAAGPEAGRPHLHAVLGPLVPRELLEDRPSIILGRQAQQEAASIIVFPPVRR